MMTGGNVVKAGTVYVMETNSGTGICTQKA